MRRAIRRTTAILAAAGLALLGLAVPQPAQAAGKCTIIMGCMWVDANFTGRTGTWELCINDFARYTLDNQASSLRNRGSAEDLFFYKDRNAGGTSVLIVDKGKKVDSLGNGWNDVISSAYFMGSLKNVGNQVCD
ncbi:MAG: peptidase inhibitor family I36 protein [Bifidobacteriaceae bacterium]|jgi:hypothetical protein|nr:peptidase inhibitor family I36 protein [Bifidobacteriaceae bacterium]